MLPSGQEEGIGIVPSKKRWERKQKARDRSVKFQGKSPTQENKSLEVFSPFFLFLFQLVGFSTIHLWWAFIPYIVS